MDQPGNSGVIVSRSLVIGPPPLGDHQVPRNLAEVLERAAEQPDVGHEHVLLEGGRVRQSYRELRQEAAQIAAGLLAVGVRPGSQVVLQLADRPSLIAAMWGCIAAGVTTAVLSCPKSYRSSDRIASQLLRALEQLDHPIVVTRASTAAALDALLRASIQRAVAIQTVEDLCTHGTRAELHSASPGDTALLLHTSGTTGSAALVAISHRQILSGALAHAEASGLEQGSPSLNWLSLNHVSNLSRSIRDVCLVADQLHVATELIVNNPLLLLDLLAKHRIHSVFAPAFGFRLLVAAAADITAGSWDLSRLRSILSSGEPHAARPLLQVAALLERHGARSVVHTGYGLTESCSTITVGPRVHEGSRGLVDSGSPVRGAAIRIVDEQGDVVATGVTGRIELAGPMIVERYLTQQAFEIRTPDGWLRTGDLGFVDDGRLTVVDREKEILIVNAINYPTREIESLAESATELSRAIACNVRLPDEDADRLLVFAVVDRPVEQHTGVADKVRAALRRTLGLSNALVVVLPASMLPETGKVSRSSLRSRYLTGELTVTAG